MAFAVRRGLLVFVILCAAVRAGRASDEEGDLRKRVDKAMSRVYPALVQIHVVTVEYQQGREFKFEAAGSGAIIDEQGHVITNHHVAGKAKLIRCRLSNFEEVDAALVGTDPLADIAIVKLDLSQRKDKSKLVTAEFGDSEKLRVGDRVLAMGCPVAISQSVTMGIVSNMQMMIPQLFWPFTFKLDGEETGTLVKWIGHDAQIFPGNSGGPLVDFNGRIVGINEIGLGLGGAIPGNLAREVAGQIVEHGRVLRSWTGLRVQPLLKGSTQQDGALVATVAKNSPAAAAGLQAGDIILKYEGKPVTVRFPEQIPEFNRRLLFTPIGKRVELEVLRGGEKQVLALTTTQGEPARGEEKELRAWGITARQLTTLAAQELKRGDKAGAYVWSVRPGGPAGDAKPAMASEDVIVAVNETPVQGLSHLISLTEAIARDGGKPVPTLVTLERKGERLLTVVKLGISDDQDKAAEVHKAWLPAAYQVLTGELAGALKLKGATGVRLTQVYPKSSAEEAGLKVGDILTHLDGDAIQSSQPEDIEVLAPMLRQYKVGSEAEFTVVRPPESAGSKIKVKLVERPKPEAQMKDYKDANFDFEARDVTYMDRVKNEWDGTQGGALVVATEPGGWAALAHLGVGDLILSIDGEGVSTVKDLEARMKSVAGKKPRHVSFFVKRGIHTMFIEMAPAWSAK